MVETIVEPSSPGLDAVDIELKAIEASAEGSHLIALWQQIRLLLQIIIDIAAYAGAGVCGPLAVALGDMFQFIGNHIAEKGRQIILPVYIQFSHRAVKFLHQYGVTADRYRRIGKGSVCVVSNQHVHQIDCPAGDDRIGMQGQAFAAEAAETYSARIDAAAYYRCRCRAPHFDRLAIERSQLRGEIGVVPEQLVENLLYRQ